MSLCMHDLRATLEAVRADKDAGRMHDYYHRVGALYSELSLQRGAGMNANTLPQFRRDFVEVLWSDSCIELVFQIQDTVELIKLGHTDAPSQLSYALDSYINFRCQKAGTAMESAEIGFLNHLNYEASTLWQVMDLYARRETGRTRARYATIAQVAKAKSGADDYTLTEEEFQNPAEWDGWA